MVASDFVAQIKAAIAEITDPQISTSSVDIDNCDREPIHIPGAIQPHGVLLVLREADWQILQVSQNTQDYLGRSPETLLNLPLSELLTEAQIRFIEQCLATEFESVNPLHFEIDVNDVSQSFAGIVHRSDEAIVLELEPADEPQKALSFFDFHRLVKHPVTQLQQTQTLEQLCQAAVGVVKQISGFDRVMVYRFDPDGAGSVIAEAKKDNLQPYLGLYYPATDVSKQARYLYLLNLLRLIPDVAYEPVPIIPPANPDTGELLDMSLSSLRSVSPLHVEYLTNMGVRATMAISLVQNDQLWGMLVCHHNSPRKLPYELRNVCEFIGQVFSLELINREHSEDADYKLNIQTLQTKFVEILTTSTSLKEALIQHREQLLSLVGATGAVFCEKGSITLLGKTPAAEAMSPLIDWLGSQFKQDVIYQTACLSQAYPAAEQFSDAASGLLAIAISQVQQIYVLWFRPEVLQTVNWAGNPNKAVEIKEDGEVRLSPRQSFELWKETVHQRSLPWKSCEVEAALELRSAVVGLVLQKAEELAQLNTELERSNDELDSFAYAASHDLKEPLRGIHTYTSFVLEDFSSALPDEGINYLTSISKLTQLMEKMVDSLLLYSGVGKAELVKEPVDTLSLVLETTKLFRAQYSDVELEFQIEPSLPTVLGDRTLLTEVFTNLISNGIKYNDSHPKRIEIGIYPVDHALASRLSFQEKETIILYVKDNGIGIGKEHQERIFKLFKRLKASRKRAKSGAGAGLTIVKRIVERHDGRILVESELGKGSIFYVILRNDN